MTEYFKDPEHVKFYMDMTKDYQAGELVSCFSNFVDNGKSVVELGMGPGKDFDILRHKYQAYGTDSSSIFVEIYKNKNPDAKVFVLDAIDMKELNKKEYPKEINAFYSNKVLMHLTKDELQTSLINQLKYLSPQGILFHSFWYGETEKEFDGLYFQYYTKDSITKLLPDNCKILDFQIYRESEADDSFYIALQKK